MEQDSKRPTNNAGNVSNSPNGLGRASAEDRLNKSIKNLSHISGGSSGTRLSTGMTASRGVLGGQGGLPSSRGVLGGQNGMQNSRGVLGGQGGAGGQGLSRGGQSGQFGMAGQQGGQPSSRGTLGGMQSQGYGSSSTQSGGFRSGYGSDNGGGTKKGKEERKKVGGVVLDLETIQEANNQKFDTRTKRNNIVILILSLLLIVSVVYLIISIVNFKNSKLEPNCKFVIAGDAKAYWVVEGNRENTNFRLGEGLESGLAYVMRSEIQIDTTASVMLTIELVIKLNDEPILIYGLHDGNENLVRVENTNKYIYQATITGGGRIHLFDGLDFSEAPDNLNSNNIQIEVKADVSIM